ncbi:MAG: ATPase [Bacteroidetes bacterium 4572_77]|nr:MAG: ATPase [Bacteroidetes bacterium 4572_77]
MISRLVISNIRKNTKLRKATILLGARQVGKTTILHELLKKEKDLLVLNGDEPDIRELLTNVNSSQLKSIFGTKKTVLIDEAQRIPNIGLSLKLITDQIPDVQLFVSGSSSLDLADIINEPLTGRKLEYQIFPLSFKEMSDHHGLLQEKRLLQTRLVYGYYPEIVNTPGKEALLLKNLTSSYLYKDILSFGTIKKPVILDKLLRALALQVGSEASYNELSRTIGADKETIERYIDLLEKSFIIFRLHAINRNVRNEIKKGKKIFFYDNGLRNAIIGDFHPFDLRTDKGALWENFIISERIKLLNLTGFYGKYYFWRTTQQQEIDFIEEIDGKFSAYEFKINPKKKHKISTTFTNAYEINKTATISPNNLEEFIC